MNVIKRDGRKVEFDKEKIKRAVLAAFIETEGEVSQYARDKAAEIARYVESVNKELTVEEIQTIVEDKLMASNHKDVARAFIVYRNTRSRIRDRNSAWMKAIKEKLSASNVQNQNANVDEHSFGGRKGEADAELTKKLALDDYMSEMSRNNHLNNEIYIHDLDSYVVGMHNCTDGDGWITIKDGSGKIRTVQIKELANEIALEDGQIAVLDEANYSILSRDGWTKLNNITRRKLKEGEPLYTIKTKTGLSLNLTGEHRLPVIREGEEILKEVKDLAVGDVLLTSENVMVSDNDLCDSFIDLSDLKDDGIDIRIFNISPLKNYIKYKYGVIFSTYAENNFEYYTGHTQKSIKLSDFKKLISRYPVSFDVLSRLKISASGSKHKYPMLIPYSSELAKLYAYIYSDGSVYENEDGSMFQVCFTNTNEEMIDDFIKCFETCFGRKLNKCYPTEQYAENNSPCIRVHCGDRIIVRLFKDYAGGIMNGSQDLRIPDFVMNGPEDVKYAYLSAAVDSDGNLNTHNINITTCCKSYAEQLSMIMNSLGYHSTVVLTDKAGSTYHFNKSSRTGIRNFDSYKVMIHRDDEKADLYAKMNTIKVFDKYSYRGISNKFAESKITAIVPKICPEESVYDLETASHWFILNNYVSHNCLTVPFDKLLANGFNTRQTDVRPAQSVNTAFQLVAVLFQLQSLQQFGGVSASHLDWTMVPYVRKSFWKHYKDGYKYLTDGKHTIWFESNGGLLPIEAAEYKENEKVYEYALDMTTKEVYQAVEGMYHNLNTLQSRSGNQLPFTSINYGTCIAPEGRLVTKAILDVSIKGIGKLHKTPIFPCGIFQYMKGVNDKPGTPNYDLYLLALESTAKRLYPNYANVDWSGNAGYDRNDPKTYFSTMGKRKLQLM